MILTENSMINNNFSDVEECTGDPFEYISNASYACAYMEAQINFSAICAEYAYLRENGVEAICEANIIVSIFTAIKNAIVKTFNAIASFFKSIFSKSTSSASSSKKKLNTTNSNVDIDLKGFKYINLNLDAAELKSLFSSVANIDDAMAEFNMVFDALDGTGNNGLSQDIVNKLNLVSSDDVKQLIIQSEDEAKEKIAEYDDIILMMRNLGNSTQDPDKLIASLKENDMCDCKLLVFNKCNSKEMQQFAKSELAKVEDLQKIASDAFNESKKILANYKKRVEDTEKLCVNALKNTSSMDEEHKKIATDLTHTVASLLNKIISKSDTLLIEANTFAGKILTMQSVTLSKLIAKITTLAAANDLKKSLNK